MSKRFIEYDLPLAEISEASAREKDIRLKGKSVLSVQSVSEKSLTNGVEKRSVC